MRKSLDKVLRHPVVLLVLGALIGSLIVPRIQEETARRQLATSRRIQSAGQILERNNQTSVLANAIATQLEHHFKVKSGRRPTLQGTASALGPSLEARMQQLYAEFDAAAWWWYWPLVDEADLGALLDSETLDELRKATEEYQQPLKQTADRLWQLHDLALVGPVDEPTGRKVEALVAELDALTAERYQKARSMAYFLLAAS